MATTSKLSFRNRNLDANRPMKVFFADEVPDLSDCAPIARGVNPMPTGMEKEEEMETHLQDAIHAQQASTSGISDNHVIPTPKVLYIDDARYDQVYPVQPPCKAQLMKVQAWLSMEREEPEYDMDTEDEEYLRDKPHISSKDLEKIMQHLEEQSSESAICQPATARKVLMPHFEDAVIDDVYDYWLSKREGAATNKTLGFGGLIPRIRTECRKENEKLNPYVAFRRRAEKMQTRKNRKNDEDSYEKVLRLGHDLRRAVHLFEMVKRREKSKLAMLDLDSEILEARAQLGDYGSLVYNQILAKLQPEEAQPMQQQQESRVPPVAAAAAEPLRAGEENGVKRRKMRKRVSSLGIGTPFDRDLPNKAWLKKNAEVWNQSATAFISGMSNFSPAVEQVDQSVAAANTANADGRYAFKRRRGCHYRQAAPLKDRNGEPPPLESLPPERRFYFVSPPSTSRGEAAAAQPEQQQQAADATDDESTAAAAAAAPRAAGAAPNRASSWLLRRRIGRGGRVVFDKFPRSTLRASGGGTEPRNGYVAGRTKSTIYDPFELDCVAMESEATSQWQAVPRVPVIESDDDDCSFAPPVSSRYLHSTRHRSLWSADDEAADVAVEVDWLATARTPSPRNPNLVVPGEGDEPEGAPRPAEDDPMGGGSSPPLQHEDSTSIPTTPLQTPAKNEEETEDDDVAPTECKASTNGTAAAAAGRGGRPPGQQPQQQDEAAEEEDDDDDEEADDDDDDEEEEPRRVDDNRDADMEMEEEEEGGVLSASEDSPIEDSPTSSSEQDHTEGSHPSHLAHHLLPLGVGEDAVHHHHQLHLASGNASVLSPPDSTAPSPRVSNGSSNGAASLAAGPMAASAASPAPHHTNGHHHTHNGQLAPGSGNGRAGGYEAARAAHHLTASAASEDADAWRARAKLVTMAEAVASRLTRVKDPDASSRESGCSPSADKSSSLPSPDGSCVIEDVVDDNGVVVRLVEPWRAPSNSPSESNSSADWTPPASTRTSGVEVDARLSAYAALSSEEESGARTGDHPSLPAKPTRKSNGAAAAAVAAGGLQRSFALAAAAAATTPL